MVIIINLEVFFYQQKIFSESGYAKVVSIPAFIHKLCPFINLRVNSLRYLCSLDFSATYQLTKTSRSYDDSSKDTVEMFQVIESDSSFERFSACAFVQARSRELLCCVGMATGEWHSNFSS